MTEPAPTWLVLFLAVVPLVDALWLRYEVRLLRRQMNRLAGEPTPADRSVAASIKNVEEDP